MSDRRVQVLLSTFFGESYLKYLMDSLLAQDYPNLEILIRDDGSKDRTIDLLQEYAASRNEINIICGKNLGFIQSFFKLFELADPSADYFALCDQDDVWLPDKISRSIQLLRSYPSEKPLLYCSRLTLVDKELKWLSYSPIPKKGLSFNNALVECSVLGCTMVLNRAGYLLLKEFPKRSVYGHDWWLYLAISAFGKIIYDRESRILYRQHENNLFGGSTNVAVDLKDKVNRFIHQGKYQPVVKQAMEFSRIYRSLLPDDSKKSLDEFIESRKSLWKRLNYTMLGDVYRQNNFDNSILKGLLLLNRL